MHTRCMERQATMTRGKRSLEDDQVDHPEPKRPALASVIVEALKMDNLQKLCSSLEPILRRIVSEEVERALAKLGPARLDGRVSPKRIEAPDGRNLQLYFKSNLSLPLFTGGKVDGEQGAAIHIVLVDAHTGHVVTSGPESSTKLDIVVLEGDFNNEDGENWTQDEFENHVVKEREGKRPLLTGDLQVTLKEGVGTLGDLTFTDNSSWIRSRKFRLGLKVASGFCLGLRIREAKTEAFTVKDHRGELYKKHYPPALDDEVWRLKKIGKDGSFHKKLNAAGLVTVEHFLQLLVRDSKRLRNILGSGMSTRMWDVLIEHAKTCVLSETHYVYYSDNSRNVGAVFNSIYELSGLISWEQYYSTDSLSETHKIYLDSLVKKAYEDWDHVIKYDGKSLLSFQPNQNLSTSRHEVAIDNQLYPAHQPSAVPSEHSSMSMVGGYGDDLASIYMPQSDFANSTSHAQFNLTDFAPRGQLNVNSLDSQNSVNDYSVGLALGPPSTTHLSNLNPFEGFFSEEEIRVKSHEMLENEEIQQLLQVWSLGGGQSINGPEEPYHSFAPYNNMPYEPPNYGYDEDRSRNGKAVVGWLKIKAAMRWGFFIRRKAAERRAQIIEIDD